MLAFVSTQLQILMNLTGSQMYQALRSGDERFDGMFYICVSSTGIYCRPVCPARTSKFENCHFVKSSAEAEEKGYRPCLRCRPESAPGSPAWLGTGATVQRALSLISDHQDFEFSIELLATKLGVSDRHLRRLFSKHLGASPQSVLLAERFSIARQLLRETNLKMTDIAMMSGFQSQRRFNDVFKKSYGFPPSQFGKANKEKRNEFLINEPPYKLRLDGDYKLRLKFGYRPPYQWASLLAYMRTRAIPQVEEVGKNYYRRTVFIDDASGVLHVTHSEQEKQLIAEIAFDKKVLVPKISQRVRNLFDLNVQPFIVSECLNRSSLLKPMINGYEGLRIPGTWSLFELCIRTIVGQQISVKGAVTILTRMVEHIGRELIDHQQEKELAGNDFFRQRLFPTAKQILLDTNQLAGSKKRQSKLKAIGLTPLRIKSIIAVSQAFYDDARFLDASMTKEQAYKKLLKLPGIGAWTAEYICLRGLRDPDSFPSSDLVLLKSAALSNPKELIKIAEQWRPWRGYAAFYLWKGI